MRIKIVNPNTTWSMTETIALTARSVARPETDIIAVSPESGPTSIESYYDEQLSAPGVIEEVIKGEKDGFDGFVIAGFRDPALQACREVSSRPVIGIGEASLHVASMLAARFSIVTVIPRIRVLLEEMVDAHGFAKKLTGIRTTPLSVLEIGNDPNRALETLRAEARAAKEEDGAEAIVLGCSGFANHARTLEVELQIPVLDGVVCAVKLAEALVDLGAATSKSMTYRRPEVKAYTGALARFGVQSVRANECD